MSATEDDTELRDLLLQNLENSGVLSKMKAEMRAAVFLAMDEQDKVENKSPLVNENLRKFLNTKDGRLLAGLIVDFLQVFHLDFTLAVFQPEIHTLKGLDRQQVSRELGLPPDEAKRKTPLLLELLRRGRPKAEVVQDSGEIRPEEKSSPVLSSKAPQEASPTKVSLSLGKGDVVQTPPSSGLRRVLAGDAGQQEQQQQEVQAEEGEEMVDLDEGDSFFDDPLPRPQKTYGW